MDCNVEQNLSVFWYKRDSNRCDGAPQGVWGAEDISNALKIAWP